MEEKIHIDFTIWRQRLKKESTPEAKGGILARIHQWLRDVFWSVFDGCQETSHWTLPMTFICGQGPLDGPLQIRVFDSRDMERRSVWFDFYWDGRVLFVTSIEHEPISQRLCQSSDEWKNCCFSNWNEGMRAFIDWYRLLAESEGDQRRLAALDRLVVAES
jgi:hypothetical protein